MRNAILEADLVYGAASTTTSCGRCSRRAAWASSRPRWTRATCIRSRASRLVPPAGGPTGNLAGRVLDDAGAPVPGARVTVAGLRGYADAVADAEGRWSITGMDVGRLPARLRPRRRRARRRGRRGRAGHRRGDDDPRHRDAPRLGGVCGRRARHAGATGPNDDDERVRPEQPHRPGRRLGVAHGRAGRGAGREDCDDPAAGGGRRHAHRDRPVAGLRRRHHRRCSATGGSRSRATARRSRRSVTGHVRAGRRLPPQRDPHRRPGGARGAPRPSGRPLLASTRRTPSSPGARSLAVTDLGVYGTRADVVAPDTSIAGGPADGAVLAVARRHLRARRLRPRRARSSAGSTAPPGPRARAAAYTGLAEGRHVFEARAADGRQRRPAPAARSWTVDVTAPETVLAAGPPEGASACARGAVTSRRSPARRSSAGSTAAWAACATPLALASLALGRHAVEVRALDAAGNVDATPAVRAWRWPAHGLRRGPRCKCRPSGSVPSARAAFASATCARRPAV